MCNNNSNCFFLLSINKLITLIIEVSTISLYFAKSNISASEKVILIKIIIYKLPFCFAGGVEEKEKNDLLVLL